MPPEEGLRRLADAVRDAKAAQDIYLARCRRAGITANRPAVPLERSWHGQAVIARLEADGGTLNESIEHQIVIIRKQSLKLRAETLQIEFQRYGDLLRLYERRFRDKERDLIEFFDARTPDELRAERATLLPEVNKIVRSPINSETDYQAVKAEIDKLSTINRDQFRKLKSTIKDWKKFKGDKIREIGAGWGLVVAVSALVFTAVGQVDRVGANTVAAYEFLRGFAVNIVQSEDLTTDREAPPVN